MRSLWGAPALRWRTAWRSKHGSRNPCPKITVTPNLFSQGHLVLELHHEIDVVDEAFPDFVVHRDLVTAIVPEQLDVLAGDAVHVPYVELLLQRALDAGKVVAVGVELAGDRVHRLLDAEVLRVGRAEHHAHVGEETEHDQANGEPDQRHAALLAPHVVPLHGLPLVNWRAGRRPVQRMVSPIRE
jgi:hypothetical protein